MNLPNKYNEAKTSDFEFAMLGGHNAIIRSVKEQISSTKKQMIAVEFDFDKGDKQPELFNKIFAADIRPNRKWPFAGTKYIMVEDDYGNCTPAFKSFIECVADSNSGFNVIWGDAFERQFEGKKIGVVFGEEEQEYKGRCSMRSLPRYFCRRDYVANAKIPNAKMLQRSSLDGFMIVGDGDELPFD